MKRRLQILSLIIASLLFARIGLGDDQTYDLSRRVQTGQKWDETMKVGVRIQTTDGPAGPMDTPGVTEDSRKFSATVMDASGGKWTKLDYFYDDCTIKNQVPGAPLAEQLSDPLSQKSITISRSLDPTAPLLLDIDAHGVALPVEIEDDLDATLSDDVMPGHPVKVGQSWSSDKVQTLFGADNTGKVDCTLDHIETLPDHRQRAVITLTGTFTHKSRPRPEAAGGHHEPHGDDARADVKVDMTSTTKFTGTMHVDLPTGLVEAIDLDGDVDLELGAAAGQPVHEHGKLIYSIRATPHPPVAPATPAPPAPPGGGDNPLSPPSPFAGIFNNDKLSLELTQNQAAFSGTITLGADQFPVTAAVKDNVLTGTFTSKGQNFSFTATLNGATLKLVTGSATYLLNRQQPINPLDPGPGRNPPDTRPANPPR